MHYGLPTSRNERIIAIVRIVLGASSLFAIWMDPAEPARFVGETYTLHAVYVAYAIAVCAFVWNRPSSPRLPLATHGIDIVMFSAFQYLTLGPSSPFFTYFIFSLFCGELRWGWRGTLGTAIVVLVAYLTMGASMSRTFGVTPLELNRFIIRSVYLCVAAILLVYLGQHEIRLRREIERLARWPLPAGAERREVLRRLLAHAAAIVGAARTLIVWENGDRSTLHLAAWSRSSLTVDEHPADAFEPLVPSELTGAIVISTTAQDDSAVAIANVGDRTWEWHGLAVHPGLRPHLGAGGLASAAFRSDRVRGRVFFSDLDAPTSELIALTEVVAREIGMSLNQLATIDELREIGASEQRIRVARDLHDGVLQSLTGIRFELQTIATSLTDQGAVRDRLFALERALAIEQRELRLFIDDLKPSGDDAATDALTLRLRTLRERIALEWKVPVTIRVAPHAVRLAEPIEQAVPLMVHEAIVNALKHAEPSRIAVDVAVIGDRLQVVVADDGRGFPFRGRFDHAELSRRNAGPASLRERAAALGGTMAIESTGSGSKVEIVLPVDLESPAPRRAQGTRQAPGIG